MYRNHEYRNIEKRNTRQYATCYRWIFWSINARFVISTDAQVLLSIFEGTTYSDPGAIEPMINRNRNFPDDNTTLLYEDPVITNIGTRLARITIGADDKKSAGGGNRDENEIVLKQNTAYLIRVTEQGIGSTTVNLVFDWYEHTNR